MTVTGAEVRLRPAEIARLLDLPEPTPEQAAVIATPLRPVVVVAGAGSGKSETMAARVVWLVAAGLVRPGQVLGLTFTRKAAAELARRVRARLDQLRRAGVVDASVLDGEPTVATYHAYAARLVADHALREALEPTLRLASPAVAWQIASGVVAAYAGPMDAVPWGPPAVTAAVLDLAGELAEHLRTPQEVYRFGEWLRGQAGDPPARHAMPLLAVQRAREQLLPLVERYQAAKQAREAIDHGDQVALAARIACRHPEVGAIERSRYAVVLLDEFQDSSHAQLVLLRALFGGGHPVTAVGDPCQSIYGWRGASAGNLGRFPRDFRDRQGRPAAVATLSTSFRSGERILRLAAGLAAELRAEAPEVPLVQPAPPLRGRGRVQVGLFASVQEEAAWIVEQVQRLLDAPAGLAPDGRPWPRPRAEPLSPAEIAVLCRRRSQFAPLRREFTARGIPVQVVGLGGLLTVPEIRDIVATLRVLADPTAGDALARLLTGPRWRLGPRDLVALGRRARELARRPGDATAEAPPTDSAEAAPSPGDAAEELIAEVGAEPGNLIEALDDLGDPAAYSPIGHARLCALAAELRALRARLDQPLPELIGDVERTLGLDVEVAARPGVDPAVARADLDAFVDAATGFADGEEEPTLAAFLSYLAAAEEQEFGLESGRVADSGSVKLLTVHAAKGLQWPVVVVPGLCAGERAGIFPSRARAASRWTTNPRRLPFPLRGDAADLPALPDLDAATLRGFDAACARRDQREERRLAYVAVTRAEFSLLATGYWWGEGRTPLGPSVFLEEIKSGCRADEIAHWAPAPEADNPVLAARAPVAWPLAPDEARLAGLREGAQLVTQAMSGAGEAWPAADGDDRLAAWEADARLLLAELDRAAARRGQPVPVELPTHLAVSDLVELAGDPGALARRLRRPLPRPPAPRARRGRVFHHWLERRYGQQRLLDDDLAETADAADLEELRACFEASPWAERAPIEVEVPFQTVIADRVVRGRIDAVFRNDAGDYEVVDWKTGPPPRDAADRRAAAVQLAAYRLAWADLAGVPPTRVRAAFHHVRENLTVWPADLPDAAELAALITRLPT